MKETTWTYLLGWQWVSLGLILIINIVYFQEGIMGWLMRKFPEYFGIAVDESKAAAKSAGKPSAAKGLPSKAAPLAKASGAVS